MIAEKVTVTIAVEEHWLVGSLLLKGGRILDVLNDFRSDFVELTDVKVHQHWKQRCVGQISKTLVPKQAAEFVIVPTGDHESPDKRLNYYRSKECFRAFAIVGGYSVAGNLQLTKASTDVRYTLVSELAHFFPLTDARLTGRTVEDFGVPLLFINKHSLSCFDVANVADGIPIVGEEEGSLSAAVAEQARH